jgi:hypothetical protein
MKRLYNRTRFAQQAFVQVTGAIALFLGKIDGGTYVALSTIALAVDATAEVVTQRRSSSESLE